MSKAKSSLNKTLEVVSKSVSVRHAKTKSTCQSPRLIHKGTGGSLNTTLVEAKSRLESIMSELKAPHSENWNNADKKEGIAKKLESVIELLSKQCTQNKLPEETKEPNRSIIKSPKFGYLIRKKDNTSVKLPLKITKPKMRTQKIPADKKTNSVSKYILEGRVSV